METHKFALPVPASPIAVTDARHRAVRAIGRWSGVWDAEVPQRAELVLSELLTNAVRHAGSSHILLTLHPLVDVLRIEVHDTSASLPQAVLPDTYSENGRGMLLVSALADRYGTERNHRGKCCWTEIDLSPAPGRRLSTAFSQDSCGDRPLLPQRHHGQRPLGGDDQSTPSHTSEAPPHRATTSQVAADIHPGDSRCW
ncbi:ATP-binding protein [Streptomyces sp. NPDC038707]|uniref:ATP-binding protein n=1 Tax=Streptomyces sp. NPDC038707 TaxID=3154329 RepID=UPI0033DEB8F7